MRDLWKSLTESQNRRQVILGGKRHCYPLYLPDIMHSGLSNFDISIENDELPPGVCLPALDESAVRIARDCLDHGDGLAETKALN
jgi:hypothetical protein